MHRKILSLTVALWPLLFLTGCISTAKMKETVPKGASIVVLAPGKPKHLFFGNYADAKTFIPFYGFAKLIEAEAAESRINQQLNAQGFDISEEWQQVLVAELRSQGIDVSVLIVDRPAESFPSPLPHSKLPKVDDGWALIDAQIGGYGLNAEMSGEFRPFLGIRVRLISAQSKAVLYDQRFAYNTWGGQAVRIPFEPADQWSDIDAVQNDLPKVRSAFITGLSKVAARVAADLTAK